MTTETRTGTTGVSVFDGVRFSAGLNAQVAQAHHWAEGLDAELFNNAYFGSTYVRPETYLWIQVSNDQRKALKHASVRRRLRRLNEAYLTESDPHHQVLALNRPLITLVRESRIPRLNRWVERNGITTQ